MGFLEGISLLTDGDLGGMMKPTLFSCKEFKSNSRFFTVALATGMEIGPKPAFPVA